MIGWVDLSQRKAASLVFVAESTEPNISSLAVPLDPSKLLSPFRAAHSLGFQALAPTSACFASLCFLGGEWNRFVSFEHFLKDLHRAAFHRW